MDYERLSHSKKTLPGTVGSYKPSSLFRSSFLLSYHRRSLLSQNLGQKPQEKHLSCEVFLQLFGYILMDTFGPSLAWNISWSCICDQNASLLKIHISALKVIQHKGEAALAIQDALAPRECGSVVSTLSNPRPSLCSRSR